MKALKIFLGISLAVVFIMTTNYLTAQTAQKRPRTEKKCEENFLKTDTDKDGKVSLKEFMAVKHQQGNTEDIFKSKDADKDGFLTKDEFCSKGVKQGNSPRKRK